MKVLANRHSDAFCVEDCGLSVLVTEKNFRRFCTKNEQNPHVNLNSKNGEFWKK